MINTQINYLTPIVNTWQSKLNNIETTTIPNINNLILSLNNNKLNTVDFNNWIWNYYNKTQIDTSLNLKWDKTTWYLKSEIDWFLNTKLDVIDFNNDKTIINNNIA